MLQQPDEQLTGRVFQQYRRYPAVALICDLRLIRQFVVIKPTVDQFIAYSKLTRFREYAKSEVFNLAETI